MATAPKTRWLRFSLRAPFVLVTVVGIGIGYPLNWIRQRHSALAWLEQRGCGPVVWLNSGVDDSAAGRIGPPPWPLRILGEPGYAWLYIDITHEDEGWTQNDLAIKDKIESLFPEAEVIIAKLGSWRTIKALAEEHAKSKQSTNTSTP